MKYLIVHWTHLVQMIFLKILNTFGNENVFVISHKQDMLFDKFRHTIKFEKNRNFSHVVT